MREGERTDDRRSPSRGVLYCIYTIAYGVGVCLGVEASVVVLCSLMNEEVGLIKELFKRRKYGIRSGAC